jgi:hypothetical protein
MKGMITKHVLLKRSSGSGMVENVTRRVAWAVATSVAPCCLAPSRIGPVGGWVAASSLESAAQGFDRTIAGSMFPV